MNPNSAPDLSELLNEWSEGNQWVENQLIELLYPDIHKIAHYQIKNQSSDVLQTTELVNEAFIKLRSQQTVKWQNKSHFLAIASKVIRRVVVDQYRASFSQKRGGGINHITLSDCSDFFGDHSSKDLDWIELDDLLSRLQKIDSAAAQVVEYRVFGGMTIPEISEVMLVSQPTVSRNWKFAKTWIQCQFQ